MNSIIIPPSPNWYFPDILACAPDGTLVYGSHMSIVIINPKPEDQPTDIKLISFAHHERISCISLNSKWGGDKKLIASAGEDKAVKVWNCNTLKLVKAHNSHTTNESKLIGATYAGSDKVISVSEDGMIIVWKVSTNELNPITNLFKGKAQITSLSSCPHAPWLCAFGLKNGLVIIADLRLSGQIKYKLKGHEKNVTDLSWCPVPVNVFPKLKTKQITLKDRMQKIYDEAKVESDTPLDGGEGTDITAKIEARTTNTQNRTDCAVITMEDLKTESSTALDRGEGTEITSKIDEARTNRMDCAETMEDVKTLKINDDAKTERVIPSDGGDVNNITSKIEAQTSNTQNGMEVENLDCAEAIEDLKTKQICGEADERKNTQNGTEIENVATTEDLKNNATNQVQIKNLQGNIEDEKQIANLYGECTKDLQRNADDKLEIENAKNERQNVEMIGTQCLQENADYKLPLENAENVTGNVKDGRENIQENEKNETENMQRNAEIRAENIQTNAKNETEIILQSTENIQQNTDNKINILGHTENVETQKEHEPQPENAENKTETENVMASSQEEIDELQKVLEKNKENTLKSSASYNFSKNNPWVNLKHADDDDNEIQEEGKPFASEEGDFLQECHSLRQKITSVIESTDEAADEPEETLRGKAMKPRRILKARKGKRGEEYAAASNIEDDLFSDLIPARKTDDDLNRSIEELLEDTGKIKSALEKATDGLERMTVGCNQVEVRSEKKAQIAGVEEEEFIGEESRKEFLLASVSSNGSIIIWRAGTDGKAQTKLSIPSKQKARNARAKDKVWMSMCWISPTLLLSSGGNGELLQWDLRNSGNGQPKSKIVHGDHQSVLFSIAAPVQKVLPVENANWREQPNALTAWTIGQERMLLNTTVDLQRKTVACYPTLGNSVQCLAASTIDPNKLAMGTADGLIKIWDLSRPHLQYVTMTTFKVKPQSKVLHLAWHPEQEGVLAYGTEEGHIGLINPSCSTKPPTLLVHYFRSSIHKLEWGAMKTRENHGLYSCSEGVLILYDTKNPLESPTVIQTPDGQYITQFSWRQDNSKLALGTREGTILLFAHDLEYQTSLYYQQKTIVSLFWHPQATAEDEEVSPYESWLASSASDGSVVVYDMKNCTDEVETPTRVVGELKEHTKFVRALSWSPHEGGKLVSASEDGSAHVWDVKNKAVLSTYLNSYCQPITACTWSPLAKDYIILGGRQCIIQIVNVNDYKPLSKADVQKELNRRKKKLGPKAVKEEQKAEEVSVVKKNVNSRDLILSSVTNLQRDKDSLLKDCHQLLALNEGNGDVDRSKSQILQLFGDQDDVHKLIQHQQQLHASKGKHTLNYHLSLWKGDIGENIRKAMTDGQLTPWLISMAPMVSPTLWQEACESYANQLADDPNGDAVQAASYYLSCHKVEKAVDVLCSKKLFKEALVLTKCRLPNEKSLIDKVITDWATYYIINGSYEVSAQCYIALEKYEDAAKALYKRSDLEILSLAIKLAEKSENPEMINAIKYRYNSFKTQHESESPKAATKSLPTKAEVVRAKEVSTSDLPTPVGIVLSKEGEISSSDLPTTVGVVLSKEEVSISDNADEVVSSKGEVSISDKADEVVSSKEDSVETAENIPASISDLPTPVGVGFSKENSVETAEDNLALRVESLVINAEAGGVEADAVE